MPVQLSLHKDLAKCAKLDQDLISREETVYKSKTLLNSAVQENTIIQLSKNVCNVETIQKGKTILHNVVQTGVINSKY